MASSRKRPQMTRVRKRVLQTTQLGRQRCLQMAEQRCLQMAEPMQHSKTRETPRVPTMTNDISTDEPGASERPMVRRDNEQAEDNGAIRRYSCEPFEFGCDVFF
mmetsp:Transcript_62121/g.85370  ORF Transcript_62121/g.85370 Transcript_62121/m.85370 type:complete len:104 (+) Transcript_62121:645-956(+)